MIPRYAVIGRPIESSLSPMLHQQFARRHEIILQYDKILSDATCFEGDVHIFFAAGGTGLNVTAPFKQQAFRMAKRHTKRALRAGVANTLWQDETGQICADNTDGVGLVSDLKSRMSLQGVRVLCLGAGGAVQAVLPTLLDEKPFSVVVYNRTAGRAKAWIEALSAPQVQYTASLEMHDMYDVVLHATGEGFAALKECLSLQGNPFCYDFSYHRSGVTPFVAWARQQGYVAVDGFGMLVQQAAEAFFVWHGAPR